MCNNTIKYIFLQKMISFTILRKNKHTPSYSMWKIQCAGGERHNRWQRRGIFFRQYLLLGQYINIIGRNHHSSNIVLEKIN